MNRNWLLSLIWFAAFMTAPFQVRAERYALLVGVSQYPTLRPAYQLEGPKNDIALARQVLATRGFQRDKITVLADGVTGADGMPTRAAIVAAFEQLIKNAQSGDYVFLYFAGHGSQQPDRSTPDGRRSPDGLQRVFLPRDVGKWSEGRRGAPAGIQNVLVDHEFRRWVDRLTASGAFVWAVFDSCHSATIVRGDVRYRGVDPDLLGVPEKALSAARNDLRLQVGNDIQSDGNPSRVNAQGKGGSAFFYAVQTTELAPEYLLPRGEPARKPYGLFGFTVMQALQTHEGITYRQIAQYVLGEYAASNVPITPLFSGTALDAQVFGDAGDGRISQWRIERAGTLKIAAGSLHQVAAGAIFAVLPSALSKPEDAIGYLRAEKVEIVSTTLVPLEFNHKPPLVAKELPEGSVARIVSSATDYTLRVAVPSRKPTAPPAMANALDGVRRNGVPGARIILQDEGDGADLRLVMADDRLWFVPPSAALFTSGPNQSISLGVDSGNLPELLNDTLYRIARATNLMRISARVGAAAAGHRLKVTATVQPKGGRRQPLSAEQVISLRGGDEVELRVTNEGGASIDVTALYIDSHYGVSLLYPAVPGASNRLVAGASDTIAVAITDDTVGLERLLFIGVIPERHEDRYDFSFLAQGALETSRGAGQTDEITEAFRRAGFNDAASRGATAKLPERTEMLTYSWRVSRE